MAKSPNKETGQWPNPTGRYATAEEANRAKNADLIAKIKKMNLKIINGQPVIEQNSKG